jgi:hypothetical protein
VKEPNDVHGGQTSDMALEPPGGTPPLYAQDGMGFGAIVHAHYFVGGCDWLATEYDPVDRVCFGWACINDRQNAELGYFSLAEMETVRVPLLLQSGDRQIRIGDSIVERDSDWPAGLTLQQAVDLVDERHGR